MTIYKTAPGEKKPDDTQPMTEVSLDPLPTEKGKTEGLPVPVVTSNRRRKNNFCLNLCVCITALVVLAGGILGGIFLYKHITHRNRYVGWCGVGMYDDDLYNGHQAGQPQYLKEKVEIDLDRQTEKIQVPQIGGTDDVIVLHDFEVNLTAIVDIEEERCFVLPLDRDVIAPPSDFLDLMLKYMNGAYTPNVRRIRREYQVQKPKLDDLTGLGWYIQNQCQNYDTYRLVPSAHTPTQLPALGGDDGHRPTWLGTTKRPLLGGNDGHLPPWLGNHPTGRPLLGRDDGHRPGSHGHGHDHRMHGMRDKRSASKCVNAIASNEAAVTYCIKK